MQTAEVGIHEGEQGQAAATDAWRRCWSAAAVWGGGTGRAVLLRKRLGESSGQSRRDRRYVGVEEVGANQLISEDSGSKAGGLNASAGNGVGAGGA